MKGDVAVGGEKFKFGSGGIPGFPSIPYGDYPVTPNEIGAWGKAHGAIGINHGSIWDPMLGRERGGIELHAGHTDELITHGCMAIAGKDWPAFKQKVMAMIKENGRVISMSAQMGRRVLRRLRALARARILRARDTGA